MVGLRALGVAVLLLLATADTAYALRIRCSEWTRLNPSAQQQRLQQMINDSPDHPMLRGRQINGTRLQICLERSFRWIEADFHEACSRGQRSNLQALNDIFTQYVSGCTSGRTRGYR